MPASLAALLAGCTSDGKLATFQVGDAPLARQLPSVCEAFLQPAPVPDWITARTDARAAFGPVADAYVEDTTRITAAKSCFADERTAYAKGKTR